MTVYRGISSSPIQRLADKTPTPESGDRGKGTGLVLQCKFYVTWEISKVKIPTGDGAQWIEYLPSILAYLDFRLHSYSHLREKLPT